MDRGGKFVLGALGVGAGITAIVMLARPAKAATPGTGTMTGLVLDAFGPLPGVRVTLDGRATTTDNRGVFGFSNVVEGAYSMSFSKAGYQTVNL